MPYKNISELPDNVKNSLPEHAQAIYINVVNSQEGRGMDESASAASGWAAVKRTYEQDKDGKWHKIEKVEGRTPPQGVQDAAKRGLELRAKQPDSNKCCTSVGIARARDLSNGKSVSLDTVKRMKAYFDRHEVDKKGEGWGKDSKGYQAWLMWGGDAGQTWANKIVKENDMEKDCGCFGIECEIKKIDQDKQLVYGWAYVSEKGGEYVIDHSGEYIHIDDLQKAAHGFMLNSRNVGDSHKVIGIGKVVESMVFTKELQDQLGIGLGKVGWMIGMKVEDKEAWDKVKGGEYKMFSIGGASRRVEA